MATNSNTASTRDRGARSARSVGKSVASAVNTDTLLDLVNRLGVVDMVLDRVRARIQESDIDDLLDEVGDYLKRTPEAIVVGLGAATLAAGALVFLNSRDHDRHGRSMKPAVDREEPIRNDFERELSETRHPRETPAAARSRAATGSPATPSRRR